MIKLAQPLPKSIAIAVSGGVDSMAALHFLSRKHDVTVLHYVHDSEYANVEFKFVDEYCRSVGISLLVEHQVPNRDRALSQEEYWRKGRYEFFNRVKMPVVTGATLDDAVEWYVFSAAHGVGKYMEYRHNQVIRPFLLTKKSELIEYAKRNNIPWLEDVSNQDPDYAARNRVRHLIIPELLKVNPGLYTVVKKRVAEKIHERVKGL